jgi:O-antigen/teichoic acid export membrane protein
VRRNVITTYVARFANVAALFVLLPLVARTVGSSAYGTYLLITSVATLLTLDLGMTSATVRFVARAYAREDREELAAVTGSSATFFVGLAVVTTAIYLGVMGIGWHSFNIPAADRHTATVLILVVAFGELLAGIPLNVYRMILSGAGRLDLANGIQCAQVLVRLGGTVAVLAAGKGIVAVTVVEAVAFVGGGAGAWLATARLVPEARARLRRTSKRVFKEMMKLSTQLLALSLGAVVILQSDNFILGVALPVAAVAVYAAGFRVYQVARELTNSLTLALLPAATASHESGQLERNRRLYLVGTRYANAALALVAVPLLIYMDPLMRAWVGPHLAEGSTVARILVASLILNNFHMVAIPILTGQGKIRRYAQLHATWAIANLAVSIALVGPLGIEGVALGTALPLIVLEPLYVREALRRLNLHVGELADYVIKPSLGLAVALGLPCLAISQLIPGNGFFEIAGVSLLWGVSYLWAFGVIGLESADRRRLGRIRNLYSSARA